MMKRHVTSFWCTIENEILSKEQKINTIYLIEAERQEIIDRVRQYDSLEYYSIRRKKLRNNLAKKMQIPVYLIDEDEDQIFQKNERH